MGKLLTAPAFQKHKERALKSMCYGQKVSEMDGDDLLITIGVLLECEEFARRDAKGTLSMLQAVNEYHRGKSDTDSPLLYR